MNERDALLRTILLAPDDDLPRLRYADWLEEHGDPDRAAFIRAMCEIAADPIAPERVGELEAVIEPWFRERRWGPGLERLFGWNYSRRNCCEWSQWTHRGPVQECVWSRGFIEVVELPHAEFTEHAGAIFAAHPVTRVTVTDAEVFPSGGNDTYYLGGLGRFPREYQRRLDGLPTRRAVLEAASAACVAFGRTAAGLPPLPAPAVTPG